MNTDYIHTGPKFMDASLNDNSSENDIRNNMEDKKPSYRPHDPGHDYYAPGIYLITLVVRDRSVQRTMFGELNNDLNAPGMRYSDVGRAVMEEWNKIPAFEVGKGRKVLVHNACCMPDHFHGVIEVLEKMDRSVGQVIWGFKVACTKRWRDIREAEPTAGVPCAGEPMTAQYGVPAGVPCTGVPGAGVPYAGVPAAARDGVPAGVPCAGVPAVAQDEVPDGRVSVQQPSLVAKSSLCPSQQPLVSKPDLHRMSKKQRAEYYAQHPEAQQPLWDDNYDDTICLSDPVTGTYSERHFTAMLKYVDDNARRAIVRRLRPQFMQRCLHVVVRVRVNDSMPHDGREVVREYAAFGNLFLLRWAKKVQVFCHRRAADGHTPYEETADYQRDREQWERQILAGGTVIVTPGISRGEYLMKERCMEMGYPLIHLQKEPIGQYWKPEAKRFDACSLGRLLILAPWKAEELGDVNNVPSATNYSVFHNLNTLAEEICRFDGDAVVIGGMKEG